MGKDNGRPWSSLNDPFSTFFQRQLGSAQALEEEAIDGIQNLVERWCARRHSMVQAYTRFGQSALEARCPQDFAEAWLELSKGAMERLAADARDQIEVGNAMARNLAEGSALSFASPFGDSASMTGAGTGAGHQGTTRH